MTAYTLLLYAHYVLGSVVSGLMFAFAFSAKWQRTRRDQADAENRKLKRRLDFYQADIRDVQAELRNRIRFEAERG